MWFLFVSILRDWADWDMYVGTQWSHRKLMGIQSVDNLTATVSSTPAYVTGNNGAQSTIMMH